MPLVDPPEAVGLRSALKGRCGNESPPGAWRAAAASAGVSGADAFLCHLSKSIAGSLESLVASAEAARIQLHSAQEAAQSGDFLWHCGELEAAIASAESAKRASLERELCLIDAVLEHLRVERSIAAEAAAFLGGTELVAQHSELMARLVTVEEQLLALPTTVVEPPYVGLVIHEPTLLAGIEVCGRVIAPRAISSSCMAVEGAPCYAYPGCTLQPSLVVTDSAVISQSAEELELSLGFAAAATHVEATLEAEGAAPQPLQATVTVDVPRRCVIVSIVVPVEAPVGSLIVLSPLTVSGQPVAGLLSPLVVEPPGPADLTPEHAAQLQAWLPPGGSRSPGTWQEVYRATTHGFGGADFHARCDGRARLLVLVRAREGGWLFGGFTAVGFSPLARYIADHSAFLFSLTNSLGHPEKLESLRTGYDLCFFSTFSATFGGGHDLYVCDAADREGNSWTWTGKGYAESASTGAHPMARGWQKGWRTAEVVAWAV